MNHFTAPDHLDFENAAFMPLLPTPDTPLSDHVSDHGFHPLEDLAFLCAGIHPASPVAVFCVILNLEQLQTRPLFDCETIATNRRGSTSLGFPGGKQDPGETHLECLIREYYEECGIRLPLTPFNILRIHHQLEANHHCFTYLILLSAEDFNAIPPTMHGTEPGISAYKISLASFLGRTEFIAHNTGVINALQTLLPLLTAPQVEPQPSDYITVCA